ncbi:hypothetical protein TNCV_2175061 [Trichonephila clavipes]|nr:hypothetical protein TNCV_2175061 [Trichonephila clavipes]
MIPSLNITSTIRRIYNEGSLTNSEDEVASGIKTVADEVRSPMEELPCLLRFDWSKPINEESGRGKGLGRSENKRPDTS